MSAKSLFNQGKVIPVIVIENLDDALPLAQAVLDGGIKVLEITLRTSVALESIKLISQNLPEAIVGAGTITNQKQLEEAQKVDSKFAISPGLTENLLEASQEIKLPLIPGIATISELMQGLEFGFSYFKFFPAESSGGINTLKSFYGPFKKIKFCPTGGINVKNYRDYLALPNVSCVGGSWIVPQNLIKEKNWSEITNLCKQI